jgi:eukaryotic-like serine/threonine-protein kinase
MHTLDPDRWQAVSAYLDQALALPEEERAAWIESLRRQNQSVAADVEALLEEHRVLERERFLETAPESPSGQERLAGRTVGAYRLIASIGEGGMGSVWLAERSDGRYARRVAVKFPRVALIAGSGGERFKREGSILGRLSHPHIADLVDAGVTPDGKPYLVLEHVDGTPIDRFCHDKALDVEGRIRLFLEVLEAVAHAHANLIVHRDLKPSNVLVTTDGRVKLLDFGIAKLLENEGTGGATTDLTREDGAAMTPEYAAPEQVTHGPITTATDVYSLGVLLFLLLTGEHPAGPGPHSPAEMVKAIVETAPPRPSATAVSERLRRVLRGDLDTIVTKALKKEPRERYASVTALADDLRRYLKCEPINARPDTLAYRTAKFVRRNRATVGLAALAFVAALGGIVGTTLQARRARVQKDLALKELRSTQAHEQLFEFILSDAAASGKPLTVDGLLERAEAMLERRHVDEADRVELILWIGQNYITQDENAKGRALLEKVFTISQDLPNPEIRAYAACMMANALARDQEVDRAEQLVQQALRDLGDDPKFDSVRIVCYRSGSEVSQDRGDAQLSLARALEARRVLRRSPLDSTYSELRTTMDLAAAYSTAGLDREALVEFERAGGLLTGLGWDDTGTAATLYNNWALELDQLGRPLDAEKHYRRAIEISRQNETEDAVSPMILNNYAHALRDLGRLDEAADYSERAYTRARKVGHELAISQSLLERARIYAARGDPARAETMLAEVEPRLRKDLPEGHYAFAVLASERSLLALTRRDAAVAMKLADQAVDIDEAAIKDGGLGAFYLPTVLVRRARIRLETGHPDEAVADVTRAVSEMEKGAAPGTWSSARGRAYLLLGRVLQAQGKQDEARSAFRTATQHLESALGADHADTRDARLLAEARPRLTSATQTRPAP